MSPNVSLVLSIKMTRILTAFSTRLATSDSMFKRMSGKLLHWIPLQMGFLRPGRCVTSSGGGIFLRKFTFWDKSKIIQFLPIIVHLFNESKISKSYISHDLM